MKENLKIMAKTKKDEKLINNDIEEMDIKEESIHDIEN